MPHKHYAKTTGSELVKELTLGSTGLQSHNLQPGVGFNPGLGAYIDWDYLGRGQCSYECENCSFVLLLITTRSLGGGRSQKGK